MGKIFFSIQVLKQYIILWPLILILAAPFPAKAIESDDFHATSLDTSLWSFINPQGDGTISVNGTQALISVPAGTSHDVWSAGNFAPRIMQPAANTDFEIEAKFESPVTAKYQMQGMLAEQDSNNFVRVDFYSDGSSTKMFAATFVNGSPQARANISLGTVSFPLYMKLQRQGNVWTLRYSLDGSNWQTVTSFSYSLIVNSVGVFAGNTGGDPAHTAVLDYFFNTASPIVPEDGDAPNSLNVTVNGNGSVSKNPDQTGYQTGEVVQLTAVPDAGWIFNGWSGALTGNENPASLVVTEGEVSVTANFENDTSPPVIENIQVTPGQTSATVSWTTDESTTGVVKYGTTLSYELGSVADTTTQLNHSVLLPGLTPGTVYHLQITATDAAGLQSVSADTLFSTQSTASVNIESDDFHTSQLNTTLWNFVHPLGDGTVSVNGTQALISVPAGTAHDVWSTGNYASRIMQPAADTDFEIETKFESSVTQKYQLQGMLAEQDSDNFIRVDFYSDGSSTRIFAATFVNGSPNAKANMLLGAVSPPLYLKLGRQGDIWTLRYSLDGSTWLTVTSFGHSLTVNSVGVFAGNAGGAPAHTAIVDYFFNTASPIVPEDGEALNSLNVTVSGNGSVSKNPDQTDYQSGEVVQLTAVPDTGWSFNGWSGDVQSDENPLAVTMNSDMVINADFVAESTTEYQLDVTTSGSGQVTLSPSGGTYSEGTTVTLSALADDGWQFTGWSGAVVSGENPLTVTMDSNMAINADFEAESTTEYQLNVTTIGSGQITLNPSGGTYSEGTTVTLTALADAGWQFAGWSGALSGNNNPVTLIMDGNVSVTGNFENDTTPPVIGNILVTAGQNAATVSWTTDESTTGTVNYGETLSYELGSVSDTTTQLNHSVSLTGLTPGIVYHLQITATDTIGLQSVSADIPFSTSTDPAANIESDDFHASQLNTALWSFVDPLADGTVSVNGTQALISVPAGTAHDVWNTGNFAPRIMQPAEDADFEIETKFESPVTEKYQLQGMLAEQDSDNFVRVDFYSDGSSTRIFAATFVNGSPKVKANVSLGAVSPPLYLKLQRQGDVWTLNYSLDGSTWQNVASFTQSLIISSVGVFAGNAGNNAPAHTAVVDYFFNTASPIVPEDDETLYSLVVTVNGSGSVIMDPDQVYYQEGDVVQLTAVSDSGWYFDGWNGDVLSYDNPLTVTMNANKAITADFLLGPGAEYQLDVTTNGSGQVTLDPPEGMYSEGTTVTLSALADAGWQFVGWSGDVTGAETPTSLIMTGDLSVTGNFEVDTIAPVIENIQLTYGPNSATVSWTTNEPATSSVEYGETTDLELGVVENTAYATSHSIELTNLQEDVTYYYQITSVDQADFTSVSDVFTLTLSGGPSIDIWYGENQTFGSIGIPQQWVNILGNVSDSDGISSLSYTLNGGAERQLSIGPFRRLEKPGDFNIDIDYAELIDGVNQVDIVASDGLGNTSDSTVLINYLSGNIWPGNYNIDWSTTAKVEDVAQIVDGLWEISNNQLHLMETGYDRTVAIGDLLWTDYEVLVPVTIHSIDPKGYQGVNVRPAVGVMVKWPGHSNWTGDQQPAWGYYPGGGGAWYEKLSTGLGRIALTDFSSIQTTYTFRELYIDTTFLFRVRVETVQNGSSQYSIKVWEAGQPEPSTWDLVAIDSNDVAGGSLLIVAHYMEISVGNISIQALGQ